MNTLNQKIILECREEVAKEYGMTHRPFKEFQRTLQLTILSKASELALDRISEFYRWACVWYVYSDAMEVWLDQLAMQKHYTELELYQIWREKP